MYDIREQEYKKLIEIVESIKVNVDSLKVYTDTLDNECYNLVNSLENNMNNIRDSIGDLCEPFLLFVMGCGNYGKSTLVNALLGESIMKQSDVPNTLRLNLFIKSSSEKVELYYSDKIILRSLSRGKNILKLEEEKYKKTRRVVLDRVHEYKKDNKVDIRSIKEYKKNLEEKYIYKSDINKVKYYLKKPNILNDFILVDSPGLNQILLEDTKNQVKDYYLKSDGVIYIIDAKNVDSKVNDMFLNEIDNMGSLSTKNIIAVVNKIDAIDEDSLAKVKSKVYKNYENKFDDILFISAKNAIDGMNNKCFELVDKSNIKTLFSSIDTNFRCVCQTKQIKAKYENLDIIKKDILKDIRNYKRSLYSDISIYNEIEFEVKEKLNQIYFDAIKHINNINNKIISNDINKDDINKTIKNLEKQLNNDIQKLYKNILNRINNQKPTKEINISISKCNSLKDIKIILQKEIEFIKLDIENIKNTNFTNKYINFIGVKNHIKYLSNIEDILINLG